MNDMKIKIEATPMGIVRKLDELGRVVIPMESRKELSWKPGTPIEMFSMKEGIFIRAYRTSDSESNG